MSSVSRREYEEVRDYLTEIQRAIGDRYFLEGKDVETIAGEVGKPKNYVRAVLHKIAKKIERRRAAGTQVARPRATFSLLDRAIARQLEPLAEKLGVLNQIAHDVGWFTIWCMMQVGKLSPSEIVEFAEECNEDPEKVYAFVRNQVQALIHAARDLEGYSELVERLRDLEVLVKWYAIKCEFYRRACEHFRELYAAAVGLMTEEQREELLKVVALRRMLGELKLPAAPEVVVS